MSKITVYTRNNCPYCTLLKRFLDMKGAKYETYNMDENPDYMNEVQKMTGHTIAPTTIIKKDDDTLDVVVGYNLARIVPAITTS